jgi:hypothetical protein
MSNKLKKGGSCGCSGGNMAGGSGYGLSVKSTPMLLGPYSGYGKMDPYSPETYDRPLSFPPLVSTTLGGKGRKSAKKSAKKSIKKSGAKKSAKKSVKKSAKKSANKSAKKSERRRKVRRVRGGSLTFSDFSPSSGVAPSGGQNISSSPFYSGDVSPLSSNMSALANPVPIKSGNNCGK